VTYVNPYMTQEMNLLIFVHSTKPEISVRITAVFSST